MKNYRFLAIPCLQEYVIFYSPCIVIKKSHIIVTNDPYIPYVIDFFEYHPFYPFLV
jgi:hypothetical protein